ncbi:MAG: type I-MYXAN CRISPR-associated protein Cas6/Cmx6 [Candidatus Thiodiazotropha endolucinida]
MNATFWQEEQDEEQFVVPDNVVDLIFRIKCPSLPVDHAWSLSDEIHRELSWFPLEPQAGLHLIYGADSGNGWVRPSDGGETLYLSRRTPLILRLPKERLDEATKLSGKTLDIDGFAMEIGKSHTRFLAMTTTLYCRYLACETGQSEDEFVQSAVESLQSLNLRFKKVLCGKGTLFTTPQAPLLTRSLMVAGLSLDDAVTLQEYGIGPHRIRGFGLFVPHKTV